MALKLNDPYEIALYYQSKKKNMSDKEIETCINVLRAIRSLGDNKHV